MNWLVPALDATIAASFVLTLAYWYIYFVERQKYLGIWTIAWAAASFRYVSMLATMYLGHETFFIMLSQWFSLANAMLLLWGVYVYLDRKLPRGWVVLAALDVLWIPAAANYGLELAYLSAPTFIFMGAAVIWMGLVFMNTGHERLLSRTIVGWVMVLWGLHKMDFPLLRQVAWFAPIGYLLAAMFSIMVAVGIILVYYEENKHMLAASERRVRRFMNSAADAIFIHDMKDGSIVDVNESACRSLGYTREELMRLRPSEIEVGFSPEELTTVTHELAPGNPGTVEGLHRKKDGTTFPVEVRLSLLEEGNAHLAMAMVRDISERKQAEEALRESEAKYRALFESQVVGVAVVTQDGRIEQANSTLQRMLGYTASELGGLSFRDVTLQDDLEENERLYRQLHHHEIESYQMEKRYVRKDGRVFWGGLSVFGVWDKTGKFRYAFAMVVDIDKRKQFEAALAESEAQFRSLAENSPNMIFINSMGKVVFANQKCEDMMEYTRQELTSPEFDFRTLIAPEFKTAVEKNFKRHMLGETVEPYEYALITKSGRRIDSIISTSLVSYEGNRAILGIVTDITAIRKAEEQLERTQFSVEHAADAVFWIEKDSKLFYANEAACRSLGYTKNELLALSVPDVDSLTNSESWAQHWEELKREGTLTLESVHKRKDGYEFPVEIIANHMKFRDHEYNCAFVRDITARRKMEESVRASLREKEVLLKEVHHRVKNNLQVISALFNMQSRHVADPVAQAQLQESRNRIRAMAMVHEKLYQSGDFSNIGLRSYLAALMEHLFGSYALESSRVRYHVDAADVALDTDTLVTLGLIVTELVSNALKYAFPDERSGTVTVEFHDNSDGKGVLRVWDDGVGLPQNISFNKAETLGLQLVDALAAQLRTNAKFEIPESGGTVFMFEGIKIKAG